MAMKEREWVIYPDVKITMDDVKKFYDMKEKNEAEAVIAGEITNEEYDVAIDEVAEEKGLGEEERELSDEEKREILIQNIKQFNNSKGNFKPIKHLNNVTVNQFGNSYKKKRQNKNKVQKKSRKANRK